MSDDKPRERLVETKRGLKAVPAAQKPMPLQDYFANEKLPEALKQYEVLVTEAGRVIEPRAPQSWAAQHDQRLDEIAERAKTSIDTHGYYLRGTIGATKKLARETDRSSEQVLDSFHDRFVARYGETPKALVQAWRQARNLPVRDSEASAHRGPEMER
ncbi:MAG: hypothetical protein AAGF76_04870 [Pseudomonadota bacterium]